TQNEMNAMRWTSASSRRKHHAARPNRFRWGPTGGAEEWASAPPAMLIGNARRSLRQKFDRHGAGGGDLALGENARLFQLGNLFRKSRGIEPSDFVRTAIGVASRDELFVDDHFPRKHHEVVRVVRIRPFERLVRRPGVAFEVIAPAVDARPREGA